MNLFGANQINACTFNSINAKEGDEETGVAWGGRDLERRVRTRKGFLATTPAKRERAGPSAMSAYPSPAATVISLLSRPGLRYARRRWEGQRNALFATSCSSVKVVRK